ncbi:MAG: hypothetical protein IJM36_04955 [Acholeplasmatales bacterium]|nr:hypothetical protein [Acholeplasmatales bacterium]
MSNLLLLIKTNLRETLDKRKFKENKKQQAFFVYIILMGVLFVVLSTFYSVVYAMQYVAIERTNDIFNLSVVFFALSTFMVFTSTISKMQSIFLGNDYEILSSLPIKKRDIVLSKIFNLYIIELTICLILIVPNSIVNTIITGNLFYLILLPLAFVAPAFAMLVALLITALMELLIKNQKAKTIISTAFTLILLVAIFGYAFYSSFSMSSGDASSGQTQMFDGISKAAGFINPSIFFLKWAFANNNFLWILAYVGSNLLLLVLVLSIVTLSYTKIHSNMTIVKTNKKKYDTSSLKLVKRTQRQQIQYLTRKQFFKSKNAIIQCGMGLVMGVIMAIFIAIFLNSTTLGDIDLGEGMKLDLKEFINWGGFALALGLIFFIGILPPASTAVSAEGKKFFILKTMPIDFKIYLQEKLKFSFIVMGVPTLLSCIILAIFVRQSPFSIIITLVFPLLYCFALSAFTLVINASFPYLNWKEDIEVYKYHKSTVITVFGDMGISFVTIMISIILLLPLSIIVNPMVAGIITGCVLIVLFGIMSLIFYLVLMKKTSKKILKIEQEE